MSSVQPPPESASRAARLDRILRELLHQTPGVEAAAVVSFDGLPMASALPAGMDEDRVAAMSAALLSLAERAAQGLGRGDLSQVYIEGEHGTVFLVSAQDEGVLIAVTTAGAKVGMMLYEVKLAANRVGEVLHGPAPLPAPLPSHVTRGYLDAQESAAAAEPAYTEPAYAEPAYAQPAYTEPAYTEPAYTAPVYTEPVYAEPTYAEAAYVEPYAETAAPEPAYSAAADPAPYAEPAKPAAVPADPPGWSSYAPTGSVLPSENGSWS
jgi:predicted regulator of Ras-like GTPase activity (Roadblock/LC7/MglB family)